MSAPLLRKRTHVQHRPKELIIPFIMTANDYNKECLQISSISSFNPKEPGICRLLEDIPRDQLKRHFERINSILSIIPTNSLPMKWVFLSTLFVILSFLIIGLTIMCFMRLSLATGFGLIPACFFIVFFTVAMVLATPTRGAQKIIESIRIPLNDLDRALGEDLFVSVQFDEHFSEVQVPVLKFRWDLE